MNTLLGRFGLGRRLMMGAVAAVTLTALYACVATGVDVDGTVGVGYVGGYYEPWGYDYGGWGRGYHVGPGRGFDHRDGHHGGRTPAYRPAPAGRSAPSLPGRARGR